VPTPTAVPVATATPAAATRTGAAVPGSQGSSGAFCPNRSRTTPCSDAVDGLKWLFADNATEKPAGALVLGEYNTFHGPTQVRVCRAYLSDGSVVVGTFPLGANFCSVPIAGEVVTTSEYELLMALPNHRPTQWMTAARAPAGDIVTGFRIEGSDAILGLCRATLAPGDVRPGYYVPRQGCITTNDAGAITRASGFEVLAFTR
jgi:hypothetical protein